MSENSRNEEGSGDPSSGTTPSEWRQPYIQPGLMVDLIEVFEPVFAVLKKHCEFDYQTGTIKVEMPPLVVQDLGHECAQMQRCPEPTGAKTEYVTLYTPSGNVELWPKK